MLALVPPSLAARALAVNRATVGGLDLLRGAALPGASLAAFINTPS